MPARELLLAAALLLLPSGVASAAPDADSSAPVVPSTPEERFEAMADSLDLALELVRTDPSFDEIAVLEAEEIAGVAEELLEEGDAELAVALMAEALSLVVPPE